MEKEGYLARKAERDKMRRSFASKQSNFAYAPTSEKIGMSLKVKQSTDLQQNNHKENKEHAMQNSLHIQWVRETVKVAYFTITQNYHQTFMHPLRASQGKGACR